MDYFKSRIAIVTGGASGLGRGLCQELGQRGTTVIVTDINVEGAQETASTINREGGQAHAVYLDVTHWEDVQKIIEQTALEYGRLDFMFNNAGVGIVGEVRDLTIEQWQDVIDINLWGTIYGTNAAYSVMTKQGWGHIINISSSSALYCYPTQVPYVAAKCAILGLSDSLRTEGVKLGVKVSTVCPGYIQTGIYDATPIINADREKMMQKVPVTPMDANRAARCILNGVARNRAIIVFPFYARFIWWLYRLNSALLTPLHRRIVKELRAERIYD